MARRRALAFVLALVTAPAGVSGAVLLLPIQLSVLHMPSPAVTPTNLLFNVAAVPRGLLRYWHEQRLLNPLTWLLISRALSGVIAGTIIRVQLLSFDSSFQFVAAGGAGVARALAGGRRPADRARRLKPNRRWQHAIRLFSLAVGTVGGIYRIGGGSLFAPILLALGYSV